MGERESECKRKERGGKKVDPWSWRGRNSVLFFWTCPSPKKMLMKGRSSMMMNLNLSSLTLFDFRPSIFSFSRFICSPSIFVVSSPLSLSLSLFPFSVHSLCLTKLTWSWKERHEATTFFLHSNINQKISSAFQLIKQLLIAIWLIVRK